MSGLFPSGVRDAHAYTRSRVPWQLDRLPTRLVHYLAGGGLKTFGRTVEQEEKSRAQTRFLRFAAVVFAVWLVLLVV